MKQIKTKIVVGTNLLLECGRNMFKRGELTREQFAEMQRRAERAPEEWKKNQIKLSAK